MLRGRVSQQFFLDTAQSLAHEIQLNARGQWAFGDRLISQETFIAGGLYSVRGYPESATSGDRGVVGSLEYRLHLPRLLPVDPKPPEILGKPFRIQPESVYGFPDWDLALIGFVDAGRTENNHVSGVNESPDETLLSAGAGVDILLRKNFRAQILWGQALKGLDNGEAEAGNDEVYLVFQLRY